MPPARAARPAETSCACCSSSSGSGVELRGRRPRARARPRARGRRTTGCAAAAARAGTCRRPAGTRQPSKPDSPSLPKPSTTRPSGSAPGSRIVRPGVVLEARERLARPGAVEQHVADHPRSPGDRVQRQDPDPRQLLACDVAVEAAEQLVAAADGEERRAVVDRLAQRVRLARRGRARRAPARGPGRRRRRRGRSRRRAPGRASPIALHVELVPARAARAPRARRCCRGRRRCSGSRDRDGRRGSSRRVLPVVRDVAARGDDLAQREHRRVGRENGQLAARAASARARGRAPRSSDGHDLDPLARQAAVGEAQRELGRAAAGRDERGRGPRAAARSRRPRSTRRHGRRRSRRSARSRATVRRAALDERAHRLVRAGRVLDQQHQQPRSPIVIRSKRPNAAAKRCEPGDDVVERRVERERERRRAERVVDVVEAGQRQLDARFALRARRA